MFAWFRNASLSAKVTVICAAFVVLAGAVGGAGLRSVRRLAATVEVTADPQGAALARLEAAHGEGDVAFRAALDSARAGFASARGAAAAEQRSASLAVGLALALLGLTSLGVVAAARWYLGATVGPLLDRLHKLRANCITSLDQGLGRMAKGDLGAEVRASTTPVEVLSRDELGQVAESFNGILGMAQSAIGSFTKAQAAVRHVITETDELASAGRAGRLSARGDESRHEGAYRQVVAGINATLEAVVAPVNEAAAVLERVAAKDLTARVTGDYQGDHAQIKRSLNTAVEAVQEAFVRISGSAQHLASSSEELSATATQMGANADDASARTAEVAAAAEQVSRNTQTVASATEEMLASIREIAQNAARAARVATEGVDASRAASTTAGRLGESSTQIGEVVRLITSIAQQTNLLALNATIEAARAGEAGKGFAVVANEVKELANQTARATEQIGQQVTALQGDSRSVVEAIDRISAIIASINDIQGAIASAVEEQSATTNEMGRNVAESATGVGSIAESMAHVARTSTETSQGAQATRAASGSLAELASELQGLVSAFRLREGREAGRSAHGARTAVGV